MITITNNKVSGFAPCWAPFRGFSLLFDNPGASVAERGGFGRIDCSAEPDPELGLYQALAAGIGKLGASALTNTHLFCPLPASSYHVTVWDGVNDANLVDLSPAHGLRCRRWLDALPQSLREVAQVRELAASALLAAPDWGLRLRLESLEKWSDISLVARLGPADDSSARALERVTAARDELSEAFAQTFGVRPNATYVPHVTLGYFANQPLAAQAGACLGPWNEVLRAAAAGLTLRVRTVSLYGFTDMATFFKLVSK